MNLLYHLVPVASAHIAPLTPGCWCEPSFCVSGLRYEGPNSDTVTRERRTHLGLWSSTARCDRVFGAEMRVGAGESLPRRSDVLVKRELFLNQGVGKARDGTRDDNIVFFTPRGNSLMVRARWDPANESEWGYQQLGAGRMWGHSVNAYVTVCVWIWMCVYDSTCMCWCAFKRLALQACLQGL